MILDLFRDVSGSPLRVWGFPVIFAVILVVRLPASGDARLSPPLIQRCVLRSPFFLPVQPASRVFNWQVLLGLDVSGANIIPTQATIARTGTCTAARPPLEPNMELEKDVGLECPATPRLEVSRPTVCQRLALDDMVFGGTERTSEARRRAPPDKGIR